MTRRMRNAVAVVVVVLVAAVGLLGARSAGDAFAEAGSEYQLMVSDSPDLSDARLLHSAEVSGDVYVFVAGPDGEPVGGAFLSTPLSFVDVADGSTHRDAIDRIAAAGITQGCSPDSYCPHQAVTRGQMATFLGRVLNLRSSAPDRFTDDASSPHEAMINRVAASGITRGCRPDRFCPSQPVNRGQMASFLARALGLEAAGTSITRFADVPQVHPHGAAIVALADAGVTAGYDDTTFRPQAPVSRAQMATFLVRAFGL